MARSGRQRLGALMTAVLCGGFVLSASSPRVGARPSVVIEQANPDPADAPVTIDPGIGSRASVSGDGRFVAYQGRPTDEQVAAGDTRASTTFLIDRETGETVELTDVPDGVRTGSSINPVLSGDGCSVVVVTELPLDVFRDDDTALRWDVYRRRLEHCGGTPGAWELVSTRADGSALARDDVGTVDAPAVSRAGTLIAYTHPADQWFDGESLRSISLVDLEQPITGDGRSQLVAGTPVAAPSTEFIHMGLDQPAISGDGRFVAYRSDAASTEAVPGWGVGRVAGGHATTQVFVWDRQELDPFRAVHLMSERTDGEPSVAGASEPTISRDGSVVAFTSADVGLVPAVLPPCPDGCPTQVFRVDRDTDENGLYDEAGRVQMSMVSSVAGSQPVVAGTAPSSQPSISADGQLVAFITKAPNLQLVKASGGGEPTDGDLLVGDAVLGTLRRVTTLDDGVRPAVGAHSRPQLSDTGRTTVFDTLAAPQLLAGGQPGRQVVAMTTMPSLSLADADLGSTLVGFPSDEWYVAVRNDGPTSFTPSSIEVSDNRFAVNREASTCALGVPVPPGGDCTVRLAFTPTGPGSVEASLTVYESGFQALSVSSSIRGSGGEPALRANPAGIEMAPVVVGQQSVESVFDVENISLVPTSVSTVRIAGANPDQFVVTSESCVGKVLNPHSTCSIGVTFAPTGSGHRTALVVIETSSGQYTTVVAAGDGYYRPELLVDPQEAEAGREFSAIGSGFAPGTEVAIFFADDPTNITPATVNTDGWLWIAVPVDPGERGGSRVLVAQAADGSAASAQIDIVEMPRSVPVLRGYGLG